MCNLAIERLMMNQNVPRRSHHIARRLGHQGARAGAIGLPPDDKKDATDWNTKTKSNIMKCKSVLHVSTFHVLTLHIGYQQSELVASVTN